ncbi:MAG: DUF507 family protein [Deltaproteobacteria bacterium]|nr:DUF507 family protein [Deltaproteobacteria bacterium]
MKLYRTKIAQIAEETIKLLAKDGDIEVTAESREEAEQDLVAIMEEYLRREQAFRNRIRDYMANRNIPYNEYGRVRSKMAEQMDMPLGDDVERFLARQFAENMLISPHVDEVYTEDAPLYKKILGLIIKHDVDETELREEALGRVKNVAEGSVEFEIAVSDAMREVKKRRGLL